MSYRELLLGCGNRKDKRIWVEEKGGGREWLGLTTLDIDPDCKPDVIFDLATVPTVRLPFECNSFDEIHAMDVLEHFGQQGDWKAFLGFFADCWRIMKPEGIFFGCSPSWESSWAWGDPGHTRIISHESLMYLSQRQYQEQVGVTPMTDYRHYYKADFELGNVNNDEPEVFKFALICKKG
jgi:predicted SAM-dependent methyltransferase